MFLVFIEGHATVAGRFFNGQESAEFSRLNDKEHELQKKKNMSAKLLLSIAAGGALGAVGRFVLMSHVGRWLGGGFPYGTLSVNVLGAFLLGVLVEVMALAWSPGEMGRAFLVVGVLGGFTTFSLFSMDVANLISRGANLQASLYMGASVALCVVGFYAGLAVFRQILA